MKSKFSALGNFEVGGKRVGQSTGTECFNVLNGTLWKRCLHRTLSHSTVYTCRNFGF